MKRLLASFVLAVALVPGALAEGPVGEQVITPITPQAEQRIEGIAPPGVEQRVETVGVGVDGVQGIAYGSKGPVQRGAEAVGKVVIGVLAAGIAIGVTVASLLFI